MRNRLLVLILFVSITGCSHRYYVVRHAEKAIAPPGNEDLAKDPNLSAAGAERTRDLQERLQDAKISRVYSTATVRTEATAAPIATYFNLPIRKYSSVDTGFINELRSLKENVLIVGHSNTVDDIVNALVPSAKMTDLPETDYDNLYIIKKKGRRFLLQKTKYGAPSAVK
ncbi:MAG TPA: histidine phosphatase family protein [Flavihumibacter sp.]|nr:histidine phosphatase family protein [Bacteroidota bacterium]HOA39048.1 histidine phosphatase family protein [Flavihumibacter sp.]HPZ87478.1 histidine phosphatase family protein [Flavihumibacter sp.]HQD11273.1 histidine phosphatase family protein [Flavihumibacter sp.]